jgi:hypothetical protein
MALDVGSSVSSTDGADPRWRDAGEAGDGAVAQAVSMRGDDQLVTVPARLDHLILGVVQCCCRFRELEI